MKDFKSLLKNIDDQFDETVEIRRTIHMNPELSFKEFKTADIIRKKLKEIGIEYKEVAGTGTVAHIGSGERCIALRADIDALPIHEETGLEYSSQNDGVMHACGHDMHTSMLLGAAGLLKKNEKSLAGTVKLIFQPAEEKLPGGALQMIREGVLENPKPDFVIGQHIFPELEAGKVAVSSGYVMASADELYWTIKGKSSHAAQPHAGNDPIIVSAQIIQHLNSVMVKRRDPLMPGVLSITSIHGGTAPNIFPEKVEMMGTMRAFDAKWRTKMHSRIDKISTEIAGLYGCDCELRIEKGYPALKNHPKAVELIKESAKNFGNPNLITNFETKMWAEDFAYYAEKLPSAFIFTGIKPKGVRSMPPLHNSRLSPDEEGMKYGIAIMTSTVLNYLNG